MQRTDQRTADLAGACQPTGLAIRREHRLGLAREQGHGAKQLKGSENGAKEAVSSRRQKAELAAERQIYVARQADSLKSGESHMLVFGPAQHQSK